MCLQVVNKRSLCLFIHPSVTHDHVVVTHYVAVLPHLPVLASILQNLPVNFTPHIHLTSHTTALYFIHHFFTGHRCPYMLQACVTAKLLKHPRVLATRFRAASLSWLCLGQMLKTDLIVHSWHYSLLFCTVILHDKCISLFYHIQWVCCLFQVPSKKQRKHCWPHFTTAHCAQKEYNKVMWTHTHTHTQWRAE